MKLLRASIKNFRLLKNIDIEFSNSIQQNITVIRAANESGKTTLLMALQWGLFGDEGLPDKGRQYRLSPIDISSDQGEQVEISVEIIYEIQQRTSSKKYRLRRYAEESIQHQTYQRSNAKVDLTMIKPTGEEPVDYPEARIKPYLPQELREIFFTDGDRALSFIEGKRGDQMKRVQAAIKSLLGLNVVKDTLQHVKKVESQLNKSIKSEGNITSDLEQISKEISDLEDQTPYLKDEFETIQQKRKNLQSYEQQEDNRLQEALAKGNKEELLKQKKEIENEWKEAENEANRALQAHANLFKSEVLGKELLQEKFQKAKKVLDYLYEQGQIPNQTIPVLEERLKQGYCICGESLEENTLEGKKRRTYIEKLIESSQNADITKRKISDLYYSTKNLLQPINDQTWSSEYKKVFNDREKADKKIKNLGEKKRNIEAQIEKLPDVNITKLKEQRDQYKKQAQEEFKKEQEIKFKINQYENDLKEKKKLRQQLLDQDEKGRKLLSELQIASDVKNILDNSIDKMETRELKKVSQEMNNLFLEMIGADQSQQAVITQAEITSEFQIIVYGQHENILDPSQDLNGASRRALTLAFILALTRVSDVQAPNVIDTPLGMMSGYVKRSVLYHAAQESSQLILFLTHSEINGCEDILDKKAGNIYTLTNVAHYPSILVNDPGIYDTRVLLCQCHHRTQCSICERKDYVQFNENNQVVEGNKNE